MFGSSHKERLQKLKAQLEERNQRINQLKEQLTAVKEARDAAREKSQKLSLELGEERRMRGNAEARVARLTEDLILSEANPLPAELPWPLPPVRLRARVGNSWSGHAFLKMAQELSKNIRTALDTAGVDRGRFRQVLDWGCGCARVMRELPNLFPNAALTGVDIDAEAIAWNQEQLGRLGTFHVIPSVPPTDLPSRHFDLVLGISVFTHLPLELELGWLKELARIVTPGAMLLLSYHGEELIQQHFTMDQAIENDRGFSYFRTAPTEGLPDHYQVSFHSEEALRRLWGAHFEILSMQPLSLAKRQGLVMCRAGR